MAWIEVHQSLRGNKKLLEFCELLNIKCEAHAVGYLVCLWLWALDNAPDGDLKGISNRIIAGAAAFRGEKKLIFVDALIESGFINRERALHNWLDYAGRLMERRRANAERMRAARRMAKGEDEARDPGACNARAGLPYPTEPNHTNLTYEGMNNLSLADGARERKRAERALRVRAAWMENLPGLCRDACGDGAEGLVYWLLNESGANDDQICCAIEYMRARHLAGNLRKPREYIKALLKDWNAKDLYTMEGIRNNREDFFA
jgi:hypothetical protein